MSLEIQAPAGFAPVSAMAFGQVDEEARMISADTPLPVTSPGGFFVAQAAFARPADTTAYAAGDRVADKTAAATLLEIPGVVRAAGDAARIERVRLSSGRAAPTLSNASFRVHLFDRAVTVTAADNAAFSASGVLAVADIAGYLGSVDVTFDRAGTVGARGAGVPAIGAGITAAPPVGTSIFAVVEALAAYTPASAEAFTVAVEGARA